MATTFLFSPWEIDSFDPGIVGVSPITPQGTAVSTTLVAAVQAAAIASGISVTAGSAGGAAVPVLQTLWQGTTAPTNNNAAWIDTSVTPALLRLWSGSAWVAVGAATGGGTGALLATNNLDDLANPLTALGNLGLTTGAINAATGVGGATQYLNGAGNLVAPAGRIFFSSAAATITVSEPYPVDTAITIGLCRLFGNPSGASLTCILQQSPDLSSWTTVQSLTLTSGSGPGPNFATPTGSPANIAAGCYSRLSCTAAGGGTPFAFFAAC